MSGGNVELRPQRKARACLRWFKGLGRATALELAKEGAHISLCGRDVHSIESTCADIAEINGDGALGFVADVTSTDDLDAF